MSRERALSDTGGPPMHLPREPGSLDHIVRTRETRNRAVSGGAERQSQEAAARARANSGATTPRPLGLSLSRGVSGEVLRSPMRRLTESGGYLWKQSQIGAQLSTGGVFEQLFFRLDVERAQLLFHVSATSEVSGRIVLADAAISPFEHPQHEFAFYLDVPSPPAKVPSYLLAARTEAERFEWMTALGSAGVVRQSAARREELEEIRHREKQEQAQRLAESRGARRGSILAGFQSLFAPLQKARSSTVEAMERYQERALDRERLAEEEARRAAEIRKEQESAKKRRVSKEEGWQEARGRGHAPAPQGHAPQDSAHSCATCGGQDLHEHRSAALYDARHHVRCRNLRRWRFAARLHAHGGCHRGRPRGRQAPHGHSALAHRWGHGHHGPCV